MTNAAELHNKLLKELPALIERTRGNLYDAALQDLEDWNQTGGTDAMIKLVPAYLQDLAGWYRYNYAQTGSEGHADLAYLALSTRSAVSSFLLEIPLYDFHPQNLGRYSLSDFGPLLAQTISAGWQDQAELIARLGFKELNRLMDRGVSYGLVGWFMLELAKDWLGAEVNLDTEFRSAEIDDLGVWDELLAGWRETDADIFDALMTKMADHHLTQSRYTEAGEKERYFEFQNLSLWLFPVELLAVLRLRQWEGIPTPALSHPLFSITPLGRLPAEIDWPQHDLLDATEAKFRGFYPSTPKLADLHSLRTAQGGQAV